MLEGYLTKLSKILPVHTHACMYVTRHTRTHTHTHTHLWQVIINDHLDPLEVHPSGHQIRANKHPNVPHTEPPEENDSVHVHVITVYIQYSYTCTSTSIFTIHTRVLVQAHMCAYEFANKCVKQYLRIRAYDIPDDIFSLLLCAFCMDDINIDSIVDQFTI